MGAIIGVVVSVVVVFALGLLWRKRQHSRVLGTGDKSRVHPSLTEIHRSQSNRSEVSMRQRNPVPTSAFLAHDWGTDELGRNNHERVSKLNACMKALGMSTWFDEEQMRGDINQKMAEGIDNTSVVVVFVTKRYMEKVAGQCGPDDNCKFEFDYALLRKGVNYMIPVVMEPRCRNTRSWVGTVGGKLGGLLYVDYADDSEEALAVATKRLVDEIQRIKESNEDMSGSTSQPMPSRTPSAPQVINVTVQQQVATQPIPMQPYPQPMVMMHPQPMVMMQPMVQQPEMAGQSMMQQQMVQPQPSHGGGHPQPYMHTEIEGMANLSQSDTVREVRLVD